MPTTQVLSRFPLPEISSMIMTTDLAQISSGMTFANGWRAMSRSLCWNNKTGLGRWVGLRRVVIKPRRPYRHLIAGLQLPHRGPSFINLWYSTFSTTCAVFTPFLMTPQSDSRPLFVATLARLCFYTKASCACQLHIAFRTRNLCSPCALSAILQLLDPSQKQSSRSRRRLSNRQIHSEIRYCLKTICFANWKKRC